MNKKDLDALNELYLSVYGGEQLNEAPGGKARFWDSNLGRFVANTGRTAGDVRDVVVPALQGVSSPTSRDARQRLTQRVTGQPVKEYPDQRAARISRAQDAAIAAADKAELKPTDKPTRTPVPRTQPAGSPPPRPAARPSGPVLSKKNGVEGTGVGADFKERAFTAAEKSRYASVAAKNAARTSASSGAATPAAAQPKPATPAVGKLGNTSFERRTPTSAELRAAQGARDKGASPEKALQAAQKTNLPTTGPTPATPDLGSVGRDLARANTVANLNRAPAGSAAAKALAAKPATSAPTPTQIAGASQGIKPINNTNPQKKLETVKSSYEWPSAKTIRDIADAYSSIYEAKKVDQDQDGDNDFADVRIARLIASGMSKEEAIAKVKNKPYNEEFVTEDPVQDFRDMRRSKENAAGMRGPELSHSAKPAGSAKQKPQKPEPRSREFSHGGTTNLTGPSSPGYDTRRLGGYDLRRLANSYEFEGNIVDEGIGSAIRGLFSKKKEEEAPKPESRGAQLRKKYNVGPEKSDTSAKRQILDRSRARAEKDEKEFGGSKYSKSVAQKSKAAHDRYLKAGYSKYGADLPYAGRGKKARERAAAMTPREKKQLNREAYEAYEFVASYLLENNFAETLNDANVIIENMSDNWFTQIMEG
jgi:hypothetical protein